MFKDFYAAEMPVIICEGKTDNVYITHAIRSMAALYPKLADKDASGKITINVRRFRYTKTSTGRILGLGGGTADLGHFIMKYRAELSRYKAPGMRHPVIVLIDNDDGAKPVYSAIKQVTKAKSITGAEHFLYIVGNLYLVATPIHGKEEQSKIEDFFDTKTKETLLMGKSFDPSNGYDKATHYGKADFAYKVVQPNADKIDFSGFQAILDRFVEVIVDHAKKHPAVVT